MALTPGNPIVGGVGALVRAFIRSPNFVSGQSGWAINKDGTAEFNELILTVVSSQAALLIYNGAAANGNLIGSWAADGGTDAFGNTYPAGLSANQGVLTGLTIEQCTLVSNVLTNSIQSNPTVSNPTISGGTITETTITFDSSGGALLAYTSTTTTITQGTGGAYQFTVPGGVTTLDVTCTGAGAGGNGGTTSKGGHGGGGGALARTKNYAVTPGDVIDYVVGNGGAGNSTGNGDGDDGSDTFFDVVNGGVYAPGGLGDGTGGQIALATGDTLHAGGNGGGTPSSTGGSGGGGSGGTTGDGGAGTTGSSSSGAAGGTAGSGSDSAAGGAGGANAANGSNGSAPGGAGGGAGSGSSSTPFSKTYTATHTHSYEGSDGSGTANALINTDGRAYQGGDAANTFNGKSKTWIVFAHSTIASDLAGVSLSSTKLFLKNRHSWYNSGMTVAVGWDTETSFGSTKSNPSGSNIDSKEYHVDEGSGTTTAIGGLGTAFKNGTAFNVVLFKNSNSLTYYGYFDGAGQSSPPKITFTGTTGGSPQTAGAGADGQVVITYTSAATLVLSISPVAGTDAFSNNYPAGIAATDIFVGTNMDKPLRYVSANYPANSDVTRANTTTPTDDGNLVLDVEANSVYEFDCFIAYSGGASGATNFKWQWSIPTGAELDLHSIYHNTSNVLVQEFHAGEVHTAFTDGVSTQRPLFEKGTLYTGASAGQVKLQWAQGTSSGTTTRVYSGTRLTLRKVG